MTPTAYGAAPGDVVHVRSSGIYGWAIRRTLRSWGNHDGVLVYDTSSDAWYVAEALCGPGYVVTPWTEYMARVAAGAASVVLLHHEGMTSAAAAEINNEALALARANPRYDWRGIFWIGYNLAFHADTGRNHEHRWYCTEAVADLYARVGLDCWEKGLPTPRTTEKRVASGPLRVFAEVRAGGHPRFQAA